jgi:hypothetical protein
MIGQSLSAIDHGEKTHADQFRIWKNWLLGEMVGANLFLDDHAQ